MTNEEPLSPGYAALADQEARFWGSVRPRSDNPQLWDDPELFNIFLRPQWERLIRTVAETGGSVLELGCGEGRLAIELARKGVRVKGLDLSAERIASAAARVKVLASEGVHSLPQFETADLNTISLPSGVYDVVVAHDALHHILRLGRLMKEIHSALKPHGRLVVYDYIGFGRIRKLLAAAMYAILPTHQSYSQKLKLSSRLGSFLRSEEGKRARLADDRSDVPEGSPFEEISQNSIVRLIDEQFEVKTMEFSHPFFFYLAPKIRLHRSVKSAAGRWMNAADELLQKWSIARGAYVYIVAVRRS